MTERENMLLRLGIDDAPHAAEESPIDYRAREQERQVERVFRLASELARAFRELADRLDGCVASRDLTRMQHIQICRPGLDLGEVRGRASALLSLSEASQKDRR